MPIISEQPPVRLKEIIYVGQAKCIVCRIYEKENTPKVCEVVFNPDKPANRDVGWDGSEWVFIDRFSSAGYADKYPRLKEFVELLRRDG